MTPSSKPFVHPVGAKIFLGNADALSALIGSRIDDPGVSAVVLDMSMLRECDSYGLRVLLGLRRKANEAGKKLLLLKPSPIFSEILKLLNLTHIFSCIDSLDAA
jgi:anti-anti-sigma factor